LSNGDIYNGEFKDDMIDGKGVFITNRGSTTIRGEWW